MDELELEHKAIDLFLSWLEKDSIPQDVKDSVKQLIHKMHERDSAFLNWKATQPTMADLAREVHELREKVEELKEKVESFIQPSPLNWLD